MRVPSPLGARWTSADVPSRARDRYANARRPVWGRTSVTSELRLRWAAPNGAPVRPRRQRGRTRARSAGRAQILFVFLILQRCLAAPGSLDQRQRHSACLAPLLTNLTPALCGPLPSHCKFRYSAAPLGSLQAEPIRNNLLLFQVFAAFAATGRFVTLRITNTLTRQKQAFVPLVDGQVSMYVCGVTAYDHCHVGHARVYVVFDVIARALRHLGFAVRYVRNFTDVDDKIIARANKNGESCDDLTNRFIAAFYEDMDQLGCQRPDVEPRVTTHMVEIVAMVQTIVHRGHAYLVAGEFGGQDVYFAIDDFAAYGALSGRSQDDNQAGASDRVTRDERKRNQADFALWKSAKPGEPAWDSPWGAGRPGWHIECSAMSCKHLGPTFDLHGGGKDLIFPHHENELAQSKAAHDAEFARYWLHNGFVTIDSEKMSKSLGNFFTIRDVLARFHPAVLRYYLLTAHYTQPLNFSDKSLEETSRRVLYIAERLAQAQAVAAKWKGLPVVLDGLASKAAADLTEALQDDFNTPKVLAVLAELVASIGQALESKDDTQKRSVLIGGLSQVQAIAQVLGLFEGDPAQLAHEIVESARERLFPADSAQLIWVQDLVQQRIAARANRDFAKADVLRGELLRGGVEVRDTREGSLWRPLLGEA